MPALSDSRFWRFLTFGALYFAQGVPWGFIGVGYVVFMADQGLSNEAVGSALALAYLPWSLKVAWGPLIDRFPSLRWGRRRPYIIVAEVLMGLTLLALALIGDLKSQLGLVSVILFAHNMCASLQDVAVDGLAVDLLKADERGRANSVMWASKSAGMALGGGGGVYFAKLTSWPTFMICTAVLIWLIMLLPLCLRERAETMAASAAQRLDWTSLRRSFSFRAPLVGLVIALVTPLGFALINAFFTRMLRADLGFDEAEIGTLTGVVEPVTGVAASLFGGYVADKIGARQTMAVGMLGLAAVMTGFGVLEPYWREYTLQTGWIVCFNFFYYMYSASSLGLYVTLSNPAVGATQFAMYMAATTACYSLSSWLGGQLADGIGYQHTFFVAAAIQAIAIVLLPLCDPRSAEARFRGQQADGRLGPLSPAIGSPMPDSGA